MTRTFASIAGAALLAFAASTFAQPAPAPQPGAAKGPRAERRYDCSKAQDPKACEARREKFRAAVAKAREACSGKQGDEHSACMSHEMCAQSSNPQRCEARAKQRAEARSRIREACKGKTGDELRSCVREHRRS